MPSVEGLPIIGVFRVVRDTTVTFVEVVMPPVLSRFRVRLQSPDCIRIGFEPINKTTQTRRRYISPNCQLKPGQTPNKKEYHNDFTHSRRGPRHYRSG